MTAYLGRKESRWQPKGQGGPGSYVARRSLLAAQGVALLLVALDVALALLLVALDVALARLVPAGYRSDLRLSCHVMS